MLPRHHGVTDWLNCKWRLNLVYAFNHTQNKWYWEKEVKKNMNRPYLDVKVVKVKKAVSKRREKIEKQIENKKNIIRRIEEFMITCPVSGRDIVNELSREIQYHQDRIKKLQAKLKRKGNWVNGENLDKLQFPFYCTFVNHEDKKVIGRVDWNYNEASGKREYQLSYADHQGNHLSVAATLSSIRELIKVFKIKVEKAKIILFEEE